MRNKELKIIQIYGAFMSVLFSFLIVYEDAWSNILKIFPYVETQAFFIFFIRIFMILHMILFMGFLLDIGIKAKRNRLKKLLDNKKKRINCSFCFAFANFSNCFFHIGFCMQCFS